MKNNNIKIKLAQQQAMGLHVDLIEATRYMSQDVVQPEALVRESLMSLAMDIWAVLQKEKDKCTIKITGPQAIAFMQHYGRAYPSDPYVMTAVASIMMDLDKHHQASRTQADMT